jgi:hypothetical protein
MHIAQYCVQHVHISIATKRAKAAQHLMHKSAHLSWYDECQTSDPFAKRFFTAMRRPSFQHVGPFMS